MNVLVTGGAGYIGSHTVLALLEAGHHVITIDDYSGGYPQLVGRPDSHYVGDFASTKLLTKIFEQNDIDGVIHFAGRIQVGESVTNPELYYWHNVAKTMVLLDYMNRYDVQRIVFSSSAAVYGSQGGTTPLTEDMMMCPENPYGRSKAAIEILLRQSKMESVCLRYFNAAGADPQMQCGEHHVPETHLIPLAIRAAATGGAFNIFGTDFTQTPDGTCVRDFVHVSDLADAHVKALELKYDGLPKIYNLGTGTGYSVKQILDRVKFHAGAEVRALDHPRRAGDPPILVADPSRAKTELGWTPKYSDLDTIVKTACDWDRKIFGWNENSAHSNKLYGDD